MKSPRWPGSALGIRTRPPRATRDGGLPRSRRVSLALAGLALLPTACWRIGEPTESSARVTWAAYPETVLVGEVFSFEFAGPVNANTCGRLDTAVVEIRNSVIELSGRRSVYDALCSKERVSFYEARSLRIERPGRYSVRTREGLRLGELVALESGVFSGMSAVGEGTIGEAGGCRLFGPGWLGNQRPFALRGVPGEVAAASGTDRVVRVEGRLAGFTLCGSFGSRPLIRVDTAWVTDRSVADYY
ncbi:MAG: hypothetical protein ACE5JR_03705 [Gemmatimonadota bacterium]